MKHHERQLPESLAGTFGGNVGRCARTGSDALLHGDAAISRAVKSQHPPVVLDIGSVIVTTPGKGGSNMIAGPWHFSFSMPFHHVHYDSMPNPIQGGETPVSH